MKKGKPLNYMPSILGARPGDAEAIARVHTKSWQHAYRGIFTAEYLDGLDWRDRLGFWASELNSPSAGSVIVVARNDDSLLGFVSAGPARDADLDSGFGEIYAIYVDPDFWSLGIGGALLTASLGRLAEAEPRVNAVALWVLAENQRARRFYEAHGFRLDGATAQIERGGVTASDIRYRCAVKKLDQSNHVR